MSNPERRSLAGLAVESGVSVPCASNLPLAMDDPQFVWFIEKGAVDLFLVERPGWGGTIGITAPDAS